MSPTSTLNSQAGVILADRLRLNVIGTEGHDLKCSCIACDSSDAMRIHQDTGVGQCYSCGKAWSAWDLCKVVAGHEEAKRIMVEAGLFEDRPSKGQVGGNGKAKGTKGSKPVLEGDVAAEIARLKGVSLEALLRYGRTIGDSVIFPMCGPDGKHCSRFVLTAKNGKGLNAKGRPVGLFFPLDNETVRLPKPSETWHGVEGVKDAAALSDLGLLAVGLPGNTLNERFAHLFKGVHVVLVPDADEPGEKGAVKTAKLLHGVAASVRVARLPVEQRSSGGADVRDVLKMPGGREKVLTAIENARPTNAEGEAVEVVKFEVITSEEFAAAKYHTEYMVKGVLPLGQQCVEGAAIKTGKTSIMIDLGVSVASGSPFLGRFTVPKARPVLIFSGESGEATLQRTALSIAQSKGANLADLPIHWCFELPQVCSDSHVAGMTEEIQRTKAELVVIDPAYLALLRGDSEGRQAGNVFDMGEALSRLSDIGKATKATMLIVHHFRKSDRRFSPFGLPDLEELSQAGFAEWCRSWILLGKREAYDRDTGTHRLWMDAGGSMGHSGLYAVDIETGRFDESLSTLPQWNVTITEPDDARAEAKKRREIAKQEVAARHVQALGKALVERPEGDTLSELAKAAGLNQANAKAAKEALLAEGVVVECEVQKGKRAYPGFRLADSQWEGEQP